MAEILGALGLVLSWLINVAPVLPRWPVGLGIIPVGAIITHGRRGETQVIPRNIVLLLLAIFVAVGRFAGWGV